MRVNFFAATCGLLAKLGMTTHLDYASAALAPTYFDDSLHYQLGQTWIEEEKTKPKVDLKKVDAKVKQANAKVTGKDSAKNAQAKTKAADIKAKADMKKKQDQAKSMKAKIVAKK